MMGKSLQIICDGCGIGITYPGNCVSYRLALEGSGAMLDHPILRRPDPSSGKGLLALREAAGIAV
jgi:hypothetical protein